MENKVAYFLSKCTGKEWSGPAWYSVKYDKSGFPEKVRLEYFHVLHLGTSGETDWDGNDLLKIYKPLIKRYPKIKKGWVKGNIHSHHSMGAFYSNTDVQQCVDNTFENMFFYSLVVSTKPGKEYHFGHSYLDQYNMVHVNQDWDVETKEVPENKLYNKEFDFIKKKAKAEKPKFDYKKYNYQVNGQASLFEKQQRTQKRLKPAINTLYDSTDPYGDYMDMAGYNGWKQEALLNESDFEDWDELQVDFMTGKITQKQFQQKAKKLGVNEYGEPLSEK